MDGISAAMRITIAEQFVDLCIKKYYGKPSEEIVELTPDEIQILFDILIVASFEVSEVVAGTITLPYNPKKVNGFCAYRAIDESGRDNVFATGWMSCMVQMIIETITGAPPTKDDFEQARERVREEIERSRPLEPIQLTAAGDEMIEDPPSPKNGNYLVDHTRDDTKFPIPRDGGESMAGMHRCCGGRFYRHPATGEYNVLVCSKCCLRVYIPRETATYGELR